MSDENNSSLANTATATCLGCGMASPRKKGSKEKPHFQVCSRCQKAKYCSQACQESDWKRHKKECRVRRVCQSCGHKSRSMIRCVCCESAFYCGESCQTHDWSKHKDACLATGKKLLSEAIEEDNEQVVSRLATCPSLINSTIDTMDLEGVTIDLAALHLCITGKKMNLLKILIEKGVANIDIGSCSPLAFALTYYLGGDQQQLPFIQELLQAGADTNKKYTERTCLSRAVLFRDEKLVKLLLDAGADPNLASQHQPLKVACFNWYPGILIDLLKAGADHEKWGAAFPITSGFGYSGSERAIEVLSTFVSHGGDLNCRSGTGKTGLAIAIAAGNVAMVEAFLKIGADMSIVPDDLEEGTILDFAVGCGNGRFELHVKHGESRKQTLKNNKKIVALLRKHFQKSASEKR